MKLSLAGPSYTSRSVVAAAQQCMNLYPEVIEAPNEPTRMVLYGRPGIHLFKQLTPPKIRALWSGGGRLFVVHGPNFSEVTEAGVVTTRTQPVAEGSLADGHPNPPDAAQIFSNGHQLMIVAGGLVYCDNGAGPEPVFFLVGGRVSSNNTTTITRIDGQVFDASMVASPARKVRINNLIHTVTGFIDVDHITVDPAVPPQAENLWSMPGYAGLPGANLLTAISGGFLDGYFIVNRTWAPGLGSGDPGRHYNISRLNEGTEWSPLDFGVKEGHSDYILSILCDHEELWLLGTESIEVHTATGDVHFTFQRIPGAFIHEGSVAPFAPCSIGQSVCWLGGGANGRTVAYRAKGFEPQRISTHAQEESWNAPGFSVRDAVSYRYMDGGHLFWVINFWAEQKTFCYDMTTGLWHERAAWDAANVQFLGYQPWFHTFIQEWGEGGRHIVGDPRTGILYEMSTNFFDDGDNAIEYLRVFPHLLNENQDQYHHRLEVYLEAGAVGAADPQMLVGLDWSDDRGHTFGHDRFALAGSAGQFTRRVAWRRLGRSRDRVYRVGIEGKSKVALIDAFLEVTPGFA